MREQGPDGLLPLWQEVSLQVQAQAYSSGFFIAGCVALAGVFLAPMLRSARPAAGGERPALHRSAPIPTSSV